MPARYLAVALLLAVVVLCLPGTTRGQERVPPPRPDEPPAVPKGVEVLARGPVHEAFASLTADPVPTKPVPRRPPKPLDELPPQDKPEGEVIWISGYWAWDDERSDYLWVSGVWRTPPPGKQWVAGYWREEGDSWQWVPGFWTGPTPAAPAAPAAPAQQVTYLPAPPATPATAPPGEPRTPDSFYVPGWWVWGGTGYAWRAGYWARVQPGYVWVPAHFRWTPSGYVFIPGYWDLAVARRGVLYAPVAVNPVVVGAGFTYTPAYAVSDAVVVDALFVRPAYCHYYFGDYYGPAYVRLGYENCYVYSRRRYDCIVVYERWDRRATANWFTLQINLYNDRCAGRVACPPRTLIQQTTIVRGGAVGITVVAPAGRVVAARGVRMVPMDHATRLAAHRQAAAVRQVALQRTHAEVVTPAGALRGPRVASFNVPKAQPVRAGMVAPPMPPATARPPAPHTAPAGHLGAPAPRPGVPTPHPGTPGASPYRPGAPARPAVQHPAARPPQPPPARRPPPRRENERH